MQKPDFVLWYGRHTGLPNRRVFKLADLEIGGTAGLESAAKLGFSQSFLGARRIIRRLNFRRRFTFEFW